MTNKDNNLLKVAKKLKISNNILILTHKNPDADTLGSALCLYYALITLNKSVRISYDTKISNKYMFMFKDYVNQDFNPECVVTTDIASESLIDYDTLKGIAKIDICIDHHKINSINSEIKLIWENAAATGEIIYELTKELGVKFNKNIATCIYTAIATDTGCFKNPNTKSISHKIAAEMMEMQIDYKTINKIMFEHKSFENFELEREAINSIEYFFNKKCAIITITSNIMKKFNLDENDLDDDFISVPTKIEGICVGITLKEKERGVKISIRTNYNYDASEIAKNFGGGGHLKAAGCYIEKDLKEVKEILLKVIGNYLL